MTYLAGHSLQCAQGSGQGVYTAPGEPAGPASIGFDFLQQPQQVPYFRTFEAERLNRSALFERLEAHLLEAAKQAGWGEDALENTPVFIGSTAYLIAHYELEYQAAGRCKELHNLHQLADDMQSRYGNNQVYCFATSCTSSAHALMQADAFMRAGLAERAFVVGIESYNLLTLMHFHSLGLLAETCKPFAGSGFILGEGAACLALSLTPPENRCLRLIACAANTATHNPVETDQASLSAVMRQALEKAQIASEDIRLIKAHAVGSAGSDAAEIEAVREVFGREMPMAAFKPLVGHTLGAAAAIETALFYQALADACLKNGAYPEREYPLENGCYLTNFFGFGGNNLSFVWEWQA